MDLEKQDQKVWALWVADCAEHVLPHFEDAHPEDDRPRGAVEAARAWAREEIKMSEARAAATAAHAAARSANEGAARAAARATGHAAATAHMVAHAPHAAAYAVKAVTAAVPTDADAAAKERHWQQRRSEHLRSASARGTI